MYPDGDGSFQFFDAGHVFYGRILCEFDQFHPVVDLHLDGLGLVGTTLEIAGQGIVHLFEALVTFQTFL